MLNSLEEFKHYLTKNEEIVRLDPLCNKPIMWGYHIMREMPKEVFKKLQNVKDVEITLFNTYPPRYVVITRTLTKKEAIEKYGKETKFATELK